MSKTYLRKRQVAQRYGNVTLRSIERAAEAGRIPHLKAGKVLLFDSETVDRLLHERAKREGVQRAS